MWFSKRVAVVRKKDGAPRERTLWLCPDCADELGSQKKCAAFLIKVLEE